MKYRQDDRNLSREEIKAMKSAEAEVRNEAYIKIDPKTKLKFLDEAGHNAVKQRNKIARQISENS